MMADILTVMWKERKGLLRHRGSRVRAALVMLGPLILAVYFPLGSEPDWVDNLVPSLILSLASTLVIVGITIPDSFAGERERHTLETLLASRLSDRAILFAKMAVPVVFAWVVLASAQALALAVFNIAHWDGRLQVYPPTILLGIVGLGFLLPLVAAGAGVLISLRASTVQAAGQLLMMILLVPIIALQVFGVVFVGIGRGGASDAMEALGTTNWTLVLL